jgi:alpha-glucuronidase
MWRAFVYSERTDDHCKTKRIVSLYYDEEFRDNHDCSSKKMERLTFKPREPFHPMFGTGLKPPLTMISNAKLGFQYALSIST